MRLTDVVIVLVAVGAVAMAVVLYVNGILSEWQLGHRRSATALLLLPVALVGFAALRGAGL